MVYGRDGITGGSDRPADKAKQDEAAVRFAQAAVKNTAVDWSGSAPLRKGATTTPNMGEFRRVVLEKPGNSNGPRAAAPPAGTGWEEYVQSAAGNAAKTMVMRTPLAIPPVVAGTATGLLLGGYSAYNLTGQNPCGTTVMPCVSSVLGAPVRPDVSLTGQWHAEPLDHLSLTYGMPKAAGGEKKESSQPQVIRTAVPPDDPSIPPDGHDEKGRPYWNLTTWNKAQNEGSSQAENAVAALTPVIKDTPVLERLRQQNPQAFGDFTPQSAKELGIAAGRLKIEGAESIAAQGYSQPFAPAISPSEAAATDGLSAAAAATHGQGRKPVQHGFDVGRIDDPAYVNGYVDRLYGKSDAATVELKDLTQRIAGQTGGEAGFRPGPKRRERVMEKVREYGGDASQLVDLAGSKITYKTLDDLYTALPTVQRELGDKLIRVKDRIRNPVNSGYGDILMNVRMSNGHIAEFRLHLKAVDDVAKIEHPLYQVRRSLDDMARAEDRQPTMGEKALDIAIQRRTHQLYKSAFRASRK